MVEYLCHIRCEILTLLFDFSNSSDLVTTVAENCCGSAVKAPDDMLETVSTKSASASGEKNSTLGRPTKGVTYSVMDTDSCSAGLWPVQPHIVET